MLRYDELLSNLFKIAESQVNKVRRLPVEGDGKLVRLVTERNVIRWFVQTAERNISESMKEVLRDMNSS